MGCIFMVNRWCFKLFLIFLYIFKTFYATMSFIYKNHSIDTKYSLCLLPQSHQSTPTKETIKKKYPHICTKENCCSKKIILNFSIIIIIIFTLHWLIQLSIIQLNKDLIHSIYHLNNNWSKREEKDIQSGSIKLWIIAIVLQSSFHIIQQPALQWVPDFNNRSARGECMLREKEQRMAF